MRKTAFLTSLLAATIFVPNLLIGQTWQDESPKFPTYNALLRKYKTAKLEIDAGNLSAARSDILLLELATTRQRANALRNNQTSTPNGSQELISRYNFLIDALNSEIAKLEAAKSPTSLRLFMGKTLISPQDEITVLYKVAENLRGKTWVGLMRADEPRSDNAYTNSPIDLTKYQPKLLDSRSEGTFKYTAPSQQGDYEIRLYEKDRGRLLAQVAFRVQLSFVDELKAWRHEIGNAFVQIELKYGYNAIKGTYIKAFEAAGANDFNGYAGSWAPSFWAAFLSKDHRNGTSVFYYNPLDQLQDSITNISVYRRKYTQAEVDHYREGMSRWRATHTRLREQFDRYIALEAEKNRDLKETQAQLRVLKGAARDAAEKAAKARSDARMSRRTAIVSEIDQLKKDPIFAYVAASAKPVTR